MESWSDSITHDECDRLENLFESSERIYFIYTVACFEEQKRHRRQQEDKIESDFGERDLVDGRVWEGGGFEFCI